MLRAEADIANFGGVLSDLMVENNLNSKMLANKIGVSQATVCTWRNNEHGIQLSNLLLLCQLFGCSLDYLVGRTENDTKLSKFNVENFGKRVREVMKSKDISSYVLRKNTRYGSKYFYDWDRGANPKLSTLIELANYFNCSLDELVGLE